jgi:YbbR domain-containing protein
MRDLLTKDLGWKLFSLFLAVTIWLTVHKINGESSEATVSTDNYEVPVLLISSGSDVHGFGESPETVSVTLSGPSDVMSKLERNEVRAMVNLTDLTNRAPGQATNRLVEVSTPSGVTLVSVDPPTVTITSPAH